MGHKHEQVRRITTAATAKTADQRWAHRRGNHLFRLGHSNSKRLIERASNSDGGCTFRRARGAGRRLPQRAWPARVLGGDRAGHAEPRRGLGIKAGPEANGPVTGWFRAMEVARPAPLMKTFRPRLATALCPRAMTGSITRTATGTFRRQNVLIFKHLCLCSPPQGSTASAEGWRSNRAAVPGRCGLRVPDRPWAKTCRNRVLAQRAAVDRGVSKAVFTTDFSCEQPPPRRRGL
jgi:hypothetical protein